MTEFNATWSGDTAKITITIYGKPIEFECDFGGEAAAMVVAQRIGEEMEKRVESIRRRAYTAGKRAARGGPKVEEFSQCINSNEVGWSQDSGEWVR